VYLDGDPEVDSTRRHMERVLKGSQGRRRWPWFAAALGGGGLWALWRIGQGAAQSREPPEGSRTGKTAPPIVRRGGGER
jgi:hypothetical protein